MLRQMASRDEVIEHINTVLLAGPEHQFFARALEYVTDHGFGRATQQVDVTSNGNTLEALLAASRQA